MECLYVTNFMPRSQCLFASGFTSIGSTFIALTLMVGHQSGTVLQRPAFEIVYAVYFGILFTLILTLCMLKLCGYVCLQILMVHQSTTH